MEYYVFAFWLGFSLIIGALGRHRNIGFLFAFLWSILLSPIIGLAITLFSKTKINHNENRSSILNQLEQIKNLQEKGILNETQFENEKTELLNKLDNPIDESSASKRTHIIGLLLFFVLIIGSGFAIKFYIHSKHNKTEIEVIDNNPTNTIQNQNSAIKTEINNTEKEYGYISGRMYYPSDGIPNSVRLIFENIETGNMVELDYSNCMDESYNYKMKLPVGAYYIFEDGFPTFVADDGNSEKSIKDNSDRKCYYTLSCNGKSNSHKKQIVKVLPNKLITNIVPCDEYYK